MLLIGPASGLRWRVKAPTWSAVALPNLRAAEYHETNVNDAELSSRKGFLSWQQARITWVVCVQTYTHTCTGSIGL